MAYWRPYTEDQEQALDLSRSIKQERVSPTPVLSPPESPVDAPEMYPAYIVNPHIPHVLPEAGCYKSFQAITQNPPYAASTISPVSTHSNELSVSTMEDIDSVSLSDDNEYIQFEQDAMRAMAERNGGSLLGNNPRMKRTVQSTLSTNDSYRVQRERNNVAAKASRDRRKLREVRLALQTTYLMKKVAEMRARLAAGVCSRCQRRCDC